MRSKENKIKTLMDKAAKGFAGEFEKCRNLFATDKVKNKLINSGEFGMYRERVGADLIRKFLP